MANANPFDESLATAPIIAITNAIAIDIADTYSVVNTLRNHEPDFALNKLEAQIKAVKKGKKQD